MKKGRSFKGSQEPREGYGGKEEDLLTSWGTKPVILKDYVEGGPDENPDHWKKGGITLIM